ncbi:YeiH family protein [Nocardia sp. NPDC088792]|uniref:YeiH family protein n=1 Tax=Nocardia sp. NPDC088792 TaxID=3364332 RepID=UPI003813BE67
MSPFEIGGYSWPRSQEIVCTMRSYLPGVALAAALATLATVLGRVLPVVGAPVLGLVAGAIVAAVGGKAFREDGPFAPGLAFARQRLLQVAIVMLGLGLPVSAVLAVGNRTAPVLIGTLAIGAIAAFAVGRMLALDAESATLVAVGTTICGASAIAAATAVMRPRRDTVGYALATIFVFNVVAVLAFPPVGRLLGMSQDAFGLWAGTAINDTSSVLAAGVIFGAAAAHFAVIVKLARSLMIVPMCLGLHMQRRRTAEPGSERLSVHKIVPVFVLLFLIASVIAGTGAIPASWHSDISLAGGWLIAAALVGIGTSLTWAQIRRAGTRPLLFGGILSVTLAVGSLALQSATGWR